MPQDAGIEVAAQGKSATLNALQSSLPLDLVINSRISNLDGSATPCYSSVVA